MGHACHCGVAACICGNINGAGLGVPSNGGQLPIQPLPPPEKVDVEETELKAGPKLGAGARWGRAAYMQLRSWQQMQGPGRSQERMALVARGRSGPCY